MKKKKKDNPVGLNVLLGAGCDTPLEVKVTRKKLTISIGIGTLAHVAANCPLLVEHPGETWEPFAKVTDPAELARDVKRALEAEEEDGTTPLHTLLDKAISDAFDDGSIAFDEHFKPRRIGSA